MYIFFYVCLLYVHIFLFLFRKCGADVITLESSDKHDRAAEIARRENRVIITSGAPYASVSRPQVESVTECFHACLTSPLSTLNRFQLRSSVPEGMCLCLKQPTQPNREQLAQVLRHFNVVVTKEDIFSRCLVSHV